MDSANQVVIVFSGVSIKPVDGEDVEFTFDTPKSIDLLQLQGDISESLVSEAVAAGEYKWALFSSHS